jgi:hypothetical protein
VLDTQIEMILHVRSAWQKLDNAPQAAAVPTVSLTGQATPGSAPMPEPKAERIRFSQSG